MKIIEYRTVSSINNSGELDDKVNEFLMIGWELWGDPYSSYRQLSRDIGSSTHNQAMVKYYD
jgi:hypothetical protein